MQPINKYITLISIEILTLNTLIKGTFMSDMNITQEQIAKAMANQGGLGMPESNPVPDIIKAATNDGIVKNVVKVTDGEMRCIVSNTNGIKDTTRKDNTTTQVYNVDEDVIIWITIINQDRQILKQDKDGIVPINVNTIDSIFGDKTPYALSFLSSFGGDNNVLMDDEKVRNFNAAQAYADAVMGEGNDGLRTLIASMVSNTDNFSDICQTWDDAEIYDPTQDNDITITWGCTAKTESEYTEFNTTYVILWAKPMILDTDGEEVPDTLLQVITRQVNPDKVPTLGADSSAVFTVDEIINEQIVAYIVVTEDTLNRKLKSIELFKTADFDVTKSSF